MRLPWLDTDDAFPPTSTAQGPADEVPGLLAAGGQLTIARLRRAYRHGIFPWYSQGQPVLWWSPDPRMVLPVGNFRLVRSLRKTLARFLRTAGCDIRFDSAFDDVIKACAQTPRSGQHGTWIVPEMAAAYGAWHRAGDAHSVEAWIDGELVGGLYGIHLGRMFFGESMFMRRTDASKFALCALVAWCRSAGITLIDCQQYTHHLASFGAIEVPRAGFEAHLRHTVDEAARIPWAYDVSQWRSLGLEIDDPALPDQALPATVPTS